MQNNTDQPSRDQPSQANDASAESTQNSGGKIETDAEQSPPTNGDGSGGEDGAPAVTDPEQAATELGESVSSQLARFTEDLQAFINNPSIETATTAFLPPLLAIGEALLILVIVVVVTSLVAKWMSNVTAAGLRRTRLEETVANFLALTVKVAIWVIAIPIALAVFGIDATALAALIGAVGLAIGLSVQGSLSNITAGIVLAIIRPIKHGDYVEVNDDDLGVVKEVGMFYSVINTFNNVRVFIPNAEVLSSRIENYTANLSRRLDIAVGVAYGTDLERAMDVLEHAAFNDVPGRYTGEDPRVLLREFGDSAINFEVQVYCPPRDFLSVRHQTVLAIDKALKAADITIAFPQRDIHFPETLRIARAETRPSRNGSGGDRNAGDSGNDPVRRHGATTHQTASDDANGDDDPDGAS